MKIVFFWFDTKKHEYCIYFSNLLFIELLIFYLALCNRFYIIDQQKGIWDVKLDKSYLQPLLFNPFISLNYSLFSITFQHQSQLRLVKISSGIRSFLYSILSLMYNAYRKYWPRFLYYFRVPPTPHPIPFYSPSLPIYCVLPFTLPCMWLCRKWMINCPLSIIPKSYSFDNLLTLKIVYIESIKLLLIIIFKETFI